MKHQDTEKWFDEWLDFQIGNCEESVYRKSLYLIRSMWELVKADQIGDECHCGICWRCRKFAEFAQLKKEMVELAKR